MEIAEWQDPATRRATLASVHAVDGRVALPNDITNAERRFMRTMLDRARSLDTWTRGLFAECLVAELLSGAELAVSTISGWDVTWEGITIAIRTTGTQCTTDTTSDGRPAHRDYAGAWLFKPKYVWVPELDDFSADKRRVWADVAVLAFHSRIVLAAGWTFFVLPATAVEGWPAMTLKPSTVGSKYPPVMPDDLPEAVRRAHSEQASAVKIGTGITP